MSLISDPQLGEFDSSPTDLTLLDVGVSQSMEMDLQVSCLVRSAAPAMSTEGDKGSGNGDYDGNGAKGPMTGPMTDEMCQIALDRMAEQMPDGVDGEKVKEKVTAAAEEMFKQLDVDGVSISVA